MDKPFLITVDYYSNFAKLDVLPKTTAGAVIRVLKAQFARHGIPNLLITDNGPQFVSAKFQEFACQWEFQHRTTSPAYPQSNGKSENAVKTVKRLIKCAKKAGSDSWLAILDFRNTPTDSLGSSPAQRLFSRRTRSLLPTSPALLKPSLVPEVSSRLAAVKARQAAKYDRLAKALPVLTPGDTVRIQPTRGHKVWCKAVVTAQLPNRSYEVRTQSGTIIRRNRRHLHKSTEVPLSPLLRPPDDGDEENTGYPSPPVVFIPSPRAIVAPTATTLSRRIPDVVSQFPPPQGTTESPDAPISRPGGADPLSTTTKTTRTGRIVKTPLYLSDYIH